MHDSRLRHQPGFQEASNLYRARSAHNASLVRLSLHVHESTDYKHCDVQHGKLVVHDSQVRHQLRNGYIMQGLIIFRRTE